jgi:hypothetical protein
VTQHIRQRNAGLDLERAAPWIISVVALMAFGATYSELQRVRGKYLVAMRPVNYHRHTDVRLLMIRAALAGLNQPAVLIGDSITEMALLPKTIDGEPFVNAGIGGASISDFTAWAPRLFDGVHPARIAVALGANDAGSNAVGTDYEALLTELQTICPEVVAIAVTPLEGSAAINLKIKAAADRRGIRFVEMPLPPGSTLQDGIHLNHAAYERWTPAVSNAIRSLGAPQS